MAGLLKDLASILAGLGKALSGPRWEQFDRELLPFLLQEPPESTRLETDGDPFEVYTALFRALRYYIADGFSNPQMQALKKLLADSERRKNSEPAEPEKAEKAPETAASPSQTS